MFLKKLLPDLYVESIYQIDLEALNKQGVRGVIADLDNTLIEWDRPMATPELASWLEQVRQDFQVVIVSNNQEDRVAKFAVPLTLPYIYRARKPLSLSFRKAVEMMDLTPEETVVVGDQLFTDILGGNRLNLYTILVRPVAMTDGFWTRFNRQMEKLALAQMRKKGLITWQESRGR